MRPIKPLQSDKLPDWTHDDLVHACVTAYEQKGWSMNKIADKLGLDYSQVRRTLRRQCVEVMGHVATLDSWQGTYRRCRVCRFHLQLSEFPKDRTKARGRSYVCLECDAKRKKLRRT